MLHLNPFFFKNWLTHQVYLLGCLQGLDLENAFCFKFLSLTMHPTLATVIPKKMNMQINQINKHIPLTHWFNQLGGCHTVSGGNGLTFTGLNHFSPKSPNNGTEAQYVASFS